jgi:hypothetical protein
MLKSANERPRLLLFSRQFPGGYGKEERMKHVSCPTVVAFCIVLLASAMPAAAGCGEACWPSGNCDNPASWDTGCYQSGSACLDLPNCWFPSAHRDQILAAAQAGDYAKVAKLAKEVGGLLRVTVKTEKGDVEAVYDGWALAGLAAPGTPGYEIQLASSGQGACDIAVTAEAEAAPEPAAAVAPQE